MFKKILPPFNVRYEALIQDVQAAEQKLSPKTDTLSRTVETCYSKLFHFKGQRKDTILKEYEARIREILDHLCAENYNLAIQLTEIPKHVQEDPHAIEKARILEADLLGKFRSIAYQIENK